MLATQTEIGEAFVRVLEHKSLQDQQDSNEEVEHADLRRIVHILTQRQLTGSKTDE